MKFDWFLGNWFANFIIEKDLICFCGVKYGLLLIYTEAAAYKKQSAVPGEFEKDIYGWR